MSPIFLSQRVQAAGTTYDLADPTNFGLHFEGEQTYDYLTFKGLVSADLDADGKDDIIVSARNAGVDRGGSVYIIYGSLLEHLKSIGKEFVLSDPSTYNIRFDSPQASNTLGEGGVQVADVTGDGKLDILVGSPDFTFAGAYSGSLFVISNSIFSSISGTGNILPLSNSNNFTIRYDGAAAAADLTYSRVFKVSDINGDSKNDIIVDSGGSIDAAYIITGTLITSQIVNPTGNIVSLGDPNSYWLKIVCGAEIDSIAAGDINGNAKNDLAIGSSGAESVLNLYDGSIWVVGDSILGGFTNPTNNSLDLATSDYSVRLNGGLSDAYIYLEKGGLADVNNDGKDEIFVSQYDEANDVYNTMMLGSSVLGDFIVNNRVLDLSNPNDYSLRIQYANGYHSEFLPYKWNDNSQYDAIITDSAVDTAKGALLIINDPTFFNVTGSGNSTTIDFSSSAGWDSKYIGSWMFERLGNDSFTLGDLNGDGGPDLIVGAAEQIQPGSDFTADSSGAMYLIYGLPQEQISPTPTPTSSSDETPTMTATAASSLSPFANISILPETGA